MPINPLQQDNSTDENAAATGAGTGGAVSQSTDLSSTGSSPTASTQPFTSPDTVTSVTPTPSSQNSVGGGTGGAVGQSTSTGSSGSGPTNSAQPANSNNSAILANSSTSPTASVQPVNSGGSVSLGGSTPNVNTQPTNPTGTLTLANGAGGATPQSTSTSVSGANTPAPTSSGSFTNLNQYLAANQDQSAGLGNKIQQGVESQAAQGLQGLSQAQQQFNQATQAAGVNPNDYSTQYVNTIANEALNNPSQLSQSDINAFNAAETKNAALQSGTSTAPQSLASLQSYQNADTQLQNAIQAANLTGTESGRATLLQGGNYQVTPPNANTGTAGQNVQITGGFQRPDYTTGQVNLDQLLTQNVPSNVQTLNNVRNQLLGQYGLANQETQAQQNATNEQAQVTAGTQQAAQNINQALYGSPNGPNATTNAAGVSVPYNPGGVLGNYQQQLQNQATNLNAAQTQNLTNAQQLVAQKLAQQYGTTTPYGINVNQLAQEIVNPASATGTGTLENTVTSDQIAKLNALNSLAGLPAGTLGTDVLTAPAAQQFTPNVNLNYTQADQQLQQQQNAIASDSQATAAQAIQSIAAPQMNTLITTGLTSGQLPVINNNVRIAGQVVGQLGGQIQNINAIRQQNQLPPLQLTSNDLNTAYQQALNMVAYQYTQARSLGQMAAYDPNTNYTNLSPDGGQLAANFIMDRYNSTNPQYQSAYRNMIQNIATANAYNNLLQTVQQNPTYQLPTNYGNVNPIPVDSNGNPIGLPPATQGS